MKYEKYKKDTKREIALMAIIKDAISVEKIDGNIFNEFYYRISVTAWASLYRKYINILQEEDLDDKFSDGWYSIIDKRKSYKTGKPPYPWCFMIFDNKVKNFIEWLKKWQNKEKGQDDKLLTDNGVESHNLALAFEDNNDVWQKAVLNEILTIVDDAKNDMQPPERKAIDMVIQGYKQREIANNLKVSLGNVNKIIKHARDILAHRFDKFGININDLITEGR